MARPSKWRLSPNARISVPTALAASFEALAIAVDKSEFIAAREILETVLQKHCQQPVLEPQEGTFTIPAPTLPVKPIDPDEVLLDDDDPIPDAVLSAAFQAETPSSESNSDESLLPPVVTEPAAISDVSTAAAASTADKMTFLLPLPSEPETAESLIAVSVVNENTAPGSVPPVVNLDAITDMLQLVEAYNRGAQDNAVAVVPENSLTTQLVVTAGAEGAADVTVEDTVQASEATTSAATAAIAEVPEATTIKAAEAVIATTIGTLESTTIETVAATVEPSKSEPMASIEVATETPESVIAETTTTVTEVPEAAAVESPDLEPVTPQTGSTTAANTALQVEPVTVISAVTLNRHETEVTASTTLPLEDFEGFGQKLAPPTLDLTEVVLVTVALTATVENVEAPAADIMSFGQELSTPTVALPPPLSLGQNVESAIVEPETESFGHACVEFEPNFGQALEAPQSNGPKLTNEAVKTTAADLETPFESSQEAFIPAPLSFYPNPNPTSMALLPEREAPDTMLVNGATKRSASQVLKTAVMLEPSEPIVSAQNSLGFSGTNESTVPDSLPATPSAAAIVETAHAVGEATAVTPTTPLPAAAPVDRVQELATFAAALFQTWQRLTLAKRGELSLCWGLNVSFDYLYREGFTHMTAYRFFVLLGTLLESETDEAYGCLQVSHQGKAAAATLNGQPLNRLTFYAPGTPKHAQNQTASKQARRKVALQPTEGSEHDMERIRQERQAHLATIEQGKTRHKDQQSRTHGPGGLLNRFTQLRRLLR